MLCARYAQLNTTKPDQYDERTILFRWDSFIQEGRGVHDAIADIPKGLSPPSSNVES